MARDNALKFTWSTIPNAWSSVTLNVGTVHTATTPAVAPPTGTVVTFVSIGGAAGGGIAAATAFFVVNSTGVSFGLSTVPGGAPLTIGTASSAIAMATVSLSPVATTLGGRSAQVKVPASPFGHWSAAYSDALNVTRYRATNADISLLTSQTVSSAIVGDAPLAGSTAGSSYYLRASVGVAGIFGPAACQVILQGNGVNQATAPAGGDIDWTPISSVGSCPANAQPLTITTSGAAGEFTVRAGVATVGSTFVPTSVASSTLVVGQQYLIGTAGKLYTSSGILITTVTANDVSGYVGSFTGYTAFASVTAANASTSLLFDSLPPSGAAVTFLTVTTAGFSTNTTYYVVPSTVNGQVGLSATFGGAAITTTAAITAGTGFYVHLEKHPYLYVSNSATGTFTSVSLLAGSLAAPHGLEVGDVVYLYSGSVAGTPALVTDQAYYVLTVPSATTFTLSATINGVVAVISSATSAMFAPVRTFKVLNARANATIRPWVRVALTNQNINYNQTGYATILFADLAIGRDNSLVN